MKTSPEEKISVLSVNWRLRVQKLGLKKVGHFEGVEARHKTNWVRHLMVFEIAKPQGETEVGVGRQIGEGGGNNSSQVQALTNSPRKEGRALGLCEPPEITQKMFFIICALSFYTVYFLIEISKWQPNVQYVYAMCSKQLTIREMQINSIEIPLSIYQKM